MLHKGWFTLIVWLYTLTGVFVCIVGLQSIQDNAGAQPDLYSVPALCSYTGTHAGMGVVLASIWIGLYLRHSKGKAVSRSLRDCFFRGPRLYTHSSLHDVYSESIHHVFFSMQLTTFLYWVCSALYLHVWQKERKQSWSEAATTLFYIHTAVYLPLALLFLVLYGFLALYVSKHQYQPQPKCTKSL